MPIDLPAWSRAAGAQSQGASQEEAPHAAAIRMAVRSEATAIMAERARWHVGLSEIPEPVATTELCALGVQIAIAASTAAQPNAATNSRNTAVGSDEPISHSASVA